jgi:predicted nucleic acid-binding protein
MFLLDTNVVSALRRPDRATPEVRAWSSSTPADSYFISVVTILELERGVLRIERRDARQGAILRRWLENEVISPLAARILTIDLVIARRAAAFHVPDPRPEGDTLIAATALAHGLTVVTRNVADFEPMGVAILNPWLAPKGD